MLRNSGALASARKSLLLGYFSLALLIGITWFWSVQASISGALIAPGIIEVEHKRQVVQHPQGGVVSALLVRDGDRVSAGDVLLRLDDSRARSELSMVNTQLYEIRARKGRLSAERDGLAQIALSADFLLLARTQPKIALLVQSQTRLFETRRDALKQENEQVQSQIDQVGERIKGVKAQSRANEGQISLIVTELENARGLFAKGLIPASRVSSLRREEARLRGSLGQLSAQMAQLRGDIAGLNIEKLRLGTQRRESAIAALQELNTRENELAQRAIALQDLLSKMHVRAPVSGVIHGSTIFALQSVLSPAAPIMFIIPQDRAMLVSARIETVDIDQVFEGQNVSLRFSALDPREALEIVGHVQRISADAIKDVASGRSYYQVDVQLSPAELGKLRGQKLVPGMPVSAFIKTYERSPLSYLMGPIIEYFNKAFRDA